MLGSTISLSKRSSISKSLSSLTEILPLAMSVKLGIDLIVKLKLFILFRISFLLDLLADGIARKR